MTRHLCVPSENIRLCISPGRLRFAAVDLARLREAVENERFAAVSGRIKVRLLVRPGEESTTVASLPDFINP